MEASYMIQFALNKHFPKGRLFDINAFGTISTTEVISQIQE